MNYSVPLPYSSEISMKMQPMLFTDQLYPKIPWYPKDGMSCKTENNNFYGIVTDNCGAAMHCNSGRCMRNTYTGTVFDGNVVYSKK